MPVNRRIFNMPQWAELGCVAIALFVAGAILRPVFLAARAAPRSSHCLSNMKQVALAEIMYASDHDDHLPPATNWMDAISPIARHQELFHCPSVPKGGGYGYAMSIELSGKDRSAEPDPAAKVLLFESVLLARNACSGVYGFPDPPRHDGRNTFAYLDGHANFHKPGEKP